MNLDQIGSTIRAARKARKLSQEALGRQFGMSRATVSGLETGRIPEVGIRKVMALCAALGLELTVQPRHAYPTLQELRRERLEG